MKRVVRAASLLSIWLILVSCGMKVEEPALPGNYNETFEIESAQVVNLSDIPEYSGKAYIEINGNVPYFTDSELSVTSYEYYSDLDTLDRCGVCIACIGQDIMPTEERGEIGNVKPTGWHTVKYNDIIDGNYLYNRCHLIGFQLAGENDNVFCYNVQPGISIDYATGDSEEDKSIVAVPEPQIFVDVPADRGSYAVNNNNGKIHIAGACPATGNGDSAMKHPVYFDTYEEAEVYSVQIALSQDKRQCGYCW